MLPLLTNFFGAITNKLTGSTTLSTYAIYGALMVCYLRKFKLGGSKFYFFLMFTSILLGLVLLNRIIFPRSYLYVLANSEYLYIMFIFYYPIAYAMASVTDWSSLFTYMRFSAIWTPVLCWITLRFFDVSKMITYMQFSNTLLPGFLAGWYIARVQKKKFYYLPSALSIYLQLFYGSRMSFASVIVFIILIEIIELRKESSAKGVIKIVVISLLAVFVYAFFQEILEVFLNLMESLGLADSRTVQSLINGSAFESESRDLIYERAQYELSNLGLGMHGLFGDRIVFEKYGGIIYVHNIFYELIFSFGFIIGGFISVWLIVKIIKEFFFRKDYMNRLMVSYFVCLIFLRLLVSGSFIIEGQFLFLIGVLCNKSTFTDVESKMISRETDDANT